MNAVKDITNVEYSKVTTELLNRIDDYKNHVKRNRMVGESHILQGIELFEDKIKELNIEILNDEKVLFIEQEVERLLRQKQEKTQMINRFVTYGVNFCFTILEGYNHTLSYSRKRINSSCCI